MTIRLSRQSSDPDTWLSPPPCVPRAHCAIRVLLAVTEGFTYSDVPTGQAMRFSSPATTLQRSLPSTQGLTPTVGSNFSAASLDCLVSAENVLWRLWIGTFDCLRRRQARPCPLYRILLYTTIASLFPQRFGSHYLSTPITANPSVAQHPDIPTSQLSYSLTHQRCCQRL